MGTNCSGLNICSYSGGKDSTASVILAHENGIKLDKIVFCEVMYDISRNISGESPCHIDFIYNVAKPTFESWGYEFVVLRSEQDFLTHFNKIMKKPRKHMENKGKRVGFPAGKGFCSIKRDCKVNMIKNYKKSLACKNIIDYVGICIDEPNRLESLHKNPNTISLLERYNYTEAMARELCESYGLLSPIYNLTKRGGCWFCPNAKLSEMSAVKQQAPELWREFIELENEPNLATYKWNVFRESLHEIDKKIDLLDSQRQMTIFDYS